MSTIKRTNCFPTIGPGMPVFRCWSPLVWLVAFLFCLNFPVPRAAAQSNTAAAYTFTTLAGYALSDSSDGVGPQARFNQPGGIAMDTNGNFYVVDELNLTIRRISAAGVVSTIAGLAGVRGDVDGMNGAARFNNPQNITADYNGNVYVTDNFTVRKISPAGTNWLVTTIAGQVNTQGYRDGGGLGTRFNLLSGLAMGTNGVIYVADGAVRKITPVGGNWVVGTVANSLGYTIIPNNSGPNFTNLVGVFNGNATAITVDGGGNLYVADQSNFAVSKLTPVGTNWVSATITGLFGSAGTADGSNSVARFQSPAGIAADGLGNLYVTDGGRTIRALTPQGTNWLVNTLAGSPGNSGNADGIGTNALFNGLYGVVADGANNLRVTDTGNNEVRKVTSAGVVRTIAGSVAVSAGSVDGVASNARFNGPAGMVVDALGNVYVADRLNTRFGSSLQLGSSAPLPDPL